MSRRCAATATANPFAADAPRRGGLGAAGRGRPLEAGLRSRLESRMGQDFSRVRIHDGGEAAASAEAMGANAYTVGREIHFAAGKYRPDTAAGQRLVAHELAHVVQQGGRPAAPQAKLSTGRAGDAFEREADRVADTVAAGGRAAPVLNAPTMVQMDPAAPSLLDRQLQLKPLNIPPPLMVPKGSVPEAWVVPKIPAPPELKLDMPPISVGYKKPPLLPPTPQLRLDPKLQFTPVDIIPVPRCDPDRKLTWADFPSSNVPGSFGGVTRMVTPQLNVDGNPMFQAQLNQVTKSAVVEKVRHADDRSKNGCAPLVAKCKRDMAKGGTWTTSRPNPDKCPAGINSINTATTVDECETVIGAGCDADAVMDSARLLAHEQLHFDISCTMVGRADDALLARSHTPAVLKKWLNDNLPVLQKKYDDESDHGCKATEQASWEADVAAGLTSVALPPPTPVTP